MNDLNKKCIFLNEEFYQTKFDPTQQIDIGNSVSDRTNYSKSKIKSPRALMNDEHQDNANKSDMNDYNLEINSINNEAGGVAGGILGAIIWDIIKFIIKLPFRIGRFAAKRMTNSDKHTLKLIIKYYNKLYPQCEDISYMSNSYKEVTLEELCKLLNVDTTDIPLNTTDGSKVTITIWKHKKELVSYFIEVLPDKNATQYEYTIGIIPDSYKQDPTFTIVCAIMEYLTKSNGKYLDIVRTLFKKNNINIKF